MKAYRWLAVFSCLGLAWLLMSAPAIPMTSQNGEYRVQVYLNDYTVHALDVTAYVQFKGQSSWEPARTFCVQSRTPVYEAIHFQTAEMPARLKYRIRVVYRCESRETLAKLEAQTRVALNDGVAHYTLTVRKAGDSYTVETNP